MSIGLDLVSYLSSKGVRTYRAAGAEIQAHCFVGCDDGDPKGKGRLYLNTETWLYSCFRCTARGNRKTLLEHFGDREQDGVTYMPGQDPGLRRKALTEATQLAVDMLDGNPDVLAYLVGRGLSVQTIVEAQIGYVPSSWSLGGSLRQTNAFADLKAAGVLTAEGQEFFSGHITIPYISHGDVVQLRGRAFVPGKNLTGPKYVTPAGDAVRLYGADDLHGARDALIVEGEFDRLVTKAALSRSADPSLRALAVVSVAGMNSLPTGFPSYFEQCRRVYVGLDPDDAGARGTERIRTLLGTKTRVVQLPQELPAIDWSDYLQPKGAGPHSGHGWRDVQNLLMDADAAGRTLYTSYDLQREWSRIETEVGGIQTGISGLDRYLFPGIKPGQLMIPIAATSAGKTAFLATLVNNMSDRPTLVVSLELTGAEFWDRLRRIAHFWNPLATTEDLNERFSKLRVFDRKLKPNDFQRLAEEFTDDVGEPPQVAIVDYVGYAAKNWSGNSQYERVSKCIIDLKEDAKAIKCGLVAPQQVHRSSEPGQPLDLNSARDAGAIEETADFLIGLFRPQDASQSVDSGVVAQILKNRNGLTNRNVQLLFSNASLVMVEKGTPEALVVGQENRLVSTGTTYEQVLQHRRKGSQTQLQLIRATS